MKVNRSMARVVSDYTATGTCYHVPAVAEAWLRNDGKTTARVEITSEQHPNLEPEQLVAKAVGILRATTKQ